MEKEELIYVQAEDRRIVLHTMEETHIGSLINQLELMLKPLGFERADANKFVQMDRILIRDKKNMMVYFDLERTKGVKITRSNKKKFFW